MRIGVLVKCPYCGSSNIEEEDTNSNRYYYLACKDCVGGSKGIGSFTVYNKNKFILYINDEGNNIKEVQK